MAAFSDFLELLLLQVTLENAATAVGGTTMYVSLHTAWTEATGDDATFTEVTGGTYARIGVTSATGWDTTVTSGVTIIDNNGAITFATATADWGTIIAFGIWDASSAGNLYFHGQVIPSVIISTNDTFEFADAALVIELQ